MRYAVLLTVVAAVHRLPLAAPSGCRRAGR